jgi:adenylate kinase family enzyme
MRRIVILGNAGSGKSTLARRLGARLGLPVVHLDVLFWEPGWREPDAEAFRERVAAAHLGEAWISEGNYARRTFDLRLPRAELVIWMDTPRLVCIGRVLARTVWERRRPDLAEGCEENIFGADFPEFLAFTWNFDRDRRQAIEAARLGHGAATPMISLRNRSQVDAFLRHASEGNTAD